VGLRNWKSGQGPKGCRAKEKERKQYVVKHTDYEAARYCALSSSFLAASKGQMLSSAPISQTPSICAFAYRDATMLQPHKAKQIQLLF
jgi:hypothetical protein